MSEDTELKEPQKKKRKRTIIPPDQVEKLETLFTQEQWPSRLRKEDLAQELGQTEHFVSVWFQNRRARQKKEELLSKQQTLDLSKLHLKPTVSVPQSVIQQVQSNYGTSDEHTRSVSLFGIDKSKTNFIIHNNGLQNADSSLFTAQRKTFIQVPHFKSSQNIITPKVVTKMLSNERDCSQFNQLAETKQPNRTEQEISSSNRTIMKILVKPKATSGEQKSIFVTKRMANYCVTVPSQTTTQKDNKLENLTDEEMKTNEEKMESIIKPETVDDQISETDEENENPPGTESPVTLFRAIINMMCVAEGGIMDPQHPEFDMAVNDALYGIKINGNTRLIYDKEIGLGFYPIIKK